MSEQTILIEAESLAAARKMAQSKIPKGFSVILEQVICDGSPVAKAEQTMDIEAETLEEALDLVDARIPEGMALVSTKVLENGIPQTARATADSTELAFTNAQSAIPSSARILDKKELVPPQQAIVIIHALDDQSAASEALKKAKAQLGETARLKDLRMTGAGDKEGLGAGKAPNQYEAEVIRPSTIEIAFQPKARVVAEIGDKLKAKISLLVSDKQWPSPGDTGYCQMCGKYGTSFKTIGSPKRAVFLCSKRCQDDYGNLRSAAIMHRDATVINVSGRDLSPLFGARASAFESKAYCWFCGKTLSMGSDRCPQCQREVDVKLPVG